MFAWVVVRIDIGRVGQLPRQQNDRGDPHKRQKRHAAGVQLAAVRHRNGRRTGRTVPAPSVDSTYLVTTPVTGVIRPFYRRLRRKIAMKLGVDDVSFLVTNYYTITYN